MSAFTDGRRNKTARKYVTQCKRCGRAIYADEPRSWDTGLLLGLSHDRCIQRGATA